MHNASSYHALPALLAGLHQTLGHVGAMAAGIASVPSPAFVLKSHPLPLTSEESVQLDSLLTVRHMPRLVCPHIVLLWIDG